MRKIYRKLTVEDFELRLVDLRRIGSFKNKEKTNLLTSFVENDLHNFCKTLNISYPYTYPVQEESDENNGLSLEWDFSYDDKRVCVIEFEILQEEDKIYFNGVSHMNDSLDKLFKGSKNNHDEYYHIVSSSFEDLTVWFKEVLEFYYENSKI